MFRHQVVRPYSLFAETYDSVLGIPFFLSIRKAFETLVRRWVANALSAIRHRWRPLCPNREWPGASSW